MGNLNAWRQRYAEIMSTSDGTRATKKVAPQDWMYFEWKHVSSIDASQIRVSTVGQKVGTDAKLDERT